MPYTIQTTHYDRVLTENTRHLDSALGQLAEVSSALSTQAEKLPVIKALNQLASRYLAQCREGGLPSLEFLSHIALADALSKKSSEAFQINNGVPVNLQPVDFEAITSGPFALNETVASIFLMGAPVADQMRVGLKHGNYFLGTFEQGLRTEFGVYHNQEPVPNLTYLRRSRQWGQIQHRRPVLNLQSIPVRDMVERTSTESVLLNRTWSHSQGEYFNEVTERFEGRGKEISIDTAGRKSLEKTGTWGDYNDDCWGLTGEGSSVEFNAQGQPTVCLTGEWDATPSGGWDIHGTASLTEYDTRGFPFLKLEGDWGCHAGGEMGLSGQGRQTVYDISGQVREVLTGKWVRGPDDLMYLSDFTVLTKYYPSGIKAFETTALQDHSRHVRGKFVGTLIQKTFFPDGNKQSELTIHHDLNGAQTGDIQETQFDRNGRRIRELKGLAVKRIGGTAAVVGRLCESSFDQEGKKTVERVGQGEIDATGQRFLIGPVTETHFHTSGHKMLEMECDYLRIRAGQSEKAGPFKITYFEPNGDVRRTRTGTIATTPHGQQFVYYAQPDTTQI